MQSPYKIGRARTNPLAAPARELPAGHPTVTEAQLRRLDHPGPLREHAATGNRLGEFIFVSVRKAVISASQNS